MEVIIIEQYDTYLQCPVFKNLKINHIIITCFFRKEPVLNYSVTSDPVNMDERALKIPTTLSII